jgi:hypothetical protein
LDLLAGVKVRGKTLFKALVMKLTRNLSRMLTMLLALTKTFQLTRSARQEGARQEGARQKVQGVVWQDEKRIAGRRKAK